MMFAVAIAVPAILIAAVSTRPQVPIEGFHMDEAPPAYRGMLDGRRVQARSGVFEARSLAGRKVTASFLWSAEP